MTLQCLARQEDPAFLEAFIAMGSMYAARWDEPEETQDFDIPAAARSNTKRTGSGKRRGSS